MHKCGLVYSIVSAETRSRRLGYINQAKILKHISDLLALKTRIWKLKTSSVQELFARIDRESHPATKRHLTLNRIENGLTKTEESNI